MLTVGNGVIPFNSSTTLLCVSGEDGESHQSVKLASLGLSRFKSYLTHQWISYFNLKCYIARSVKHSLNHHITYLVLFVAGSLQVVGGLYFTVLVAQKDIVRSAEIDTGVGHIV